jgi:hypothetical protein
MEIIQHIKNVQYRYLLNNNKMGHLEGNFTPVLYIADLLISLSSLGIAYF